MPKYFFLFFIFFGNIVYGKEVPFHGKASVFIENKGQFISSENHRRDKNTVIRYKAEFSSMDIYLTNISNRMNSVMKVLTIIATIFIPITFIAGVYGMNFKYFPEVEWKWG